MIEAGVGLFGLAPSAGRLLALSPEGTVPAEHEASTEPVGRDREGMRVYSYSDGGAYRTGYLRNELLAVVLFQHAIISEAVH